MSYTPTARDVGHPPCLATTGKQRIGRRCDLASPGIAPVHQQRKSHSDIPLLINPPCARPRRRSRRRPRRTRKRMGVAELQIHFAAVPSTYRRTNLYASIQARVRLPARPSPSNCIRALWAEVVSRRWACADAGHAAPPYFQQRPRTSAVNIRARDMPIASHRCLVRCAETGRPGRGRHLHGAPPQNSTSSTQDGKRCLSRCAGTGACRRRGGAAKRHR